LAFFEKAQLDIIEQIKSGLVASLTRARRQRHAASARAVDEGRRRNGDRRQNQCRLVATTNLFGAILSARASGLAGGVGVAPSLYQAASTP
jgi:hypothetical protein